jgi:hypothetical protein
MSVQWIKRCGGLASSEPKMVKRLVEQYQVNDVVEIKMRNGEWITAVVIKHQHPGIWAQTTTGHQWFVTNPRRIRHKTPG